MAQQAGLGWAGRSDMTASLAAAGAAVWGPDVVKLHTLIYEVLSVFIKCNLRVIRYC